MHLYFNIIYGASTLLIFLIGILALAGNYKSKSNWTFFLFSISVVGWMLSLYLGYWFADQSQFDTSLIFIRSAYLYSLFGMSFMTIFFYYFPRINISIPLIIKWVFVIFTVILSLLSVFTPLIHESLIIIDGVYVKDTLGPLYSLYAFHILLNLLLSIGLGINKLLKIRGIEKAKIIFAFFGYLAFVFFAVMTNVILPIFDIFIFQKEVPVLTLAFVLPAFYAIKKYRFFNISNLSLNLLDKLLLLSVFLATTCVSFEFLRGIYPKIHIHIIGLSSALIGLGFLKLTKYLLPELISESFREFRDTLAEFKSKIYTCDNHAKFQKIIEKIFLVKLNLVNAKIFIIRKKGGYIDHIPVYAEDKFTEELKAYKKDILIEDEIRFKKIGSKIKRILISAMQKLEADLCLPLFSERNLIGFFALKRKESEAHYSKEEIEELIKIKKDLEICLMNILLKMNLEEENNLMKAIINKKTKELQKRFKEIQDLLDQQSDFIAVTAHELRTPLNIAMFQLEEVLESTKKPSELIRDLKVIDSSLVNLKNLTQKLFDVQQFDLNKVKLCKKKTDMRKFIKNIYENFLLVMKGKKINFTLKNKLKSKTYLYIDQSQIRQVMHNLLSNAYKFTNKGGKVVLTAEEDKKNILLKVSDSGKGISDSSKKTIFDKFRTKKPGVGIGLGLYISKKIIDLHKGKIWVEDSTHKGAMFCIKLRK